MIGSDRFCFIFVLFFDLNTPFLTLWSRFDSKSFLPGLGEYGYKLSPQAGKCVSWKLRSLQLLRMTAK